MLSLRPYQDRAKSALLSNNRAVIQSPAGSGKTIIGASALNEWVASGVSFYPSVIWLANTMEQCTQAHKAVDLFPSLKEKCQLKVACYASGVNCASAELVILDECHHIAAPEIRKCLNGFNGVRWGLSATPTRADEFSKDVFDLIGPIVCVIERKELLEAGNLAEAVVHFHKPNVAREYENLIDATAEPIIAQRERFWRVPPDEIRSRTIWQLCQKIAITENQKRNEAILKIAFDHSSDSKLLLVSTVEHGELFSSGIPNSVVAHSKMGKKKRLEAMERFRSRDLKCLIATSLADEGLDLPCASVLILASGGRSAAKAEQRTGRVLRPYEGKVNGLIHDFWDHQHYFLLAQSKARERVYKSLGYSVEFQD